MDRQIVFRNDDVNANTDTFELRKIYKAIYSAFGNAKIWSCVTLFSDFNEVGSVYKQTPFKYQPTEWFYSAKNFYGDKKTIGDSVCSHGLYHVDHSKLSKDAQAMSILGSCKFLRSGIFVPPFNKYNDDTIDICLDNKISLITPEQGWKSLDYNEFDPNHSLWYLHSWRFTADMIEEKLISGIRNKKDCPNLG